MTLGAHGLVPLWWALGGVGVLVGTAFLWPARIVEPRAFDARSALAPATQLRVLWVGHSLMNHRDPEATPSRNIPEVVGTFARERGVNYEALDHTLFGAPLSLLWRGSPHSYRRSEPDVVVRRSSLLEGSVDALVLTEGIPVERSLEEEHSAYYAQRFRCAVLASNPGARVYVYEAWSHLFASDESGGYPRPSVYDWRARLATDRAFVERLSDTVASGRGVSPPPFGGFFDALGGGIECSPGNVYLVPVGTVFRALADLLSEEELPFRERGMHVRDLFANPFTSWPEGWPLEEALSEAEESAALAALTTVKKDAPLDDIHPSDLGVYVAALVHFATLYGQSPVGLSNPVRGLPETSAQRLQELVWRVVTSDARTGVGSRLSR